VTVPETYNEFSQQQEKREENAKELKKMFFRKWDVCSDASSAGGDA
jgi:hypothetical protein